MADFGLIDGLANALTFANLGYALVGCMLGMLVGILPGLGPASAMAILLPTTMYLPPAGSIIIMAGIYYGAMYAGSTTAILMNIPGEVASVVTAIDGFQMTKKGRAGEALAIAAIGSFIAGIAGTLAIAWTGPALAELALQFGPPEYFGLVLFSLTALISFAGRSLLARRRDGRARHLARDHRQRSAERHPAHDLRQHPGDEGHRHHPAHRRPVRHRRGAVQRAHRDEAHLHGQAAGLVPDVSARQATGARPRFQHPRHRHRADHGPAAGHGARAHHLSGLRRRAQSQPPPRRARPGRDRRRRGARGRQQRDRDVGIHSAAVARHSDQSRARDRAEHAGAQRPAARPDAVHPARGPGLHRRSPAW